METIREKIHRIENYFQRIHIETIDNHSRWQKEIGHYHIKISSTIPKRIQQMRQDIIYRYQKICFGTESLLKNFKSQCKQDIFRTRELSTLKIQQLKTHTESLYRETVAQGPQRTLRRGFIIARNDQKKPITTVTMAVSAGSINLEFCDGKVHVDSLKRVE